MLFNGLKLSIMDGQRAAGGPHSAPALTLIFFGESRGMGVNFIFNRGIGTVQDKKFMGGDASGIRQ